MNRDRFVVLGVAPARAPWFRAVGQWAHAASVPVEFLKCLSPEEVRARLGSGQPFSALLADAGVPAVDRDLLSAAARADCAVVVVENTRVRRDWLALGASATLPADFDREQLVSVLLQHAVHVAAPEEPAIPAEPAPGTEPGLVVAVTGPGGTGTSTATIALAQGLAADRRWRGGVVLVDLCLRAEQAMLHDVQEVGPGLHELVDAHRVGILAPPAVRGLTFNVLERRYDLLLGLRRARFWAALRPRALEAAFESLSASYAALVCDVDSDLEGEAESGSLDVEERNGLSRMAVQRADVVVAVGTASMKGVHSLAVVIADLHEAGADGAVLAALNFAPRSPRTRAEFTAALHQIVGATSPDRPLFGPVFLPERKVDTMLRDGVPLPAALVDPLSGAVVALVTDGTRRRSTPAPLPVRPGSLGTWAEPATG